MNRFLFFLFVTCCFRSFAQDSLTVSDFQGTWHLTAERFENDPLVEADEPYVPGFKWRYPDVHWIIKGDKIYEIAYPCCLQNTFTFKTMKTGLIVQQGDGRRFNEMMYSVSFPKDSMQIEAGMYTSHTMFFEKDTLPKKEVDKMIGGTINPTCLYGDWEIPVGEVSVPYDAIMVYYPFKLPETIHIDSNNLYQYWANGKLYLEVNGVKRPFKVSDVSLHDDNMTIIPENWVDRYNKATEYGRYECSSVWLRKIPAEIEN